MARLFGTDGVRGEANMGLCPELAYRMGRAAALYFGEKAEGERRPVIVIGRDTRLSGSMFENALAAGVCSAGGQVVQIGVIPTPGIAYLAQQMGAVCGIVVSASHNPFGDNGIKFFGGDGYKLPDAVEDEIENLVTAIEQEDVFTRSFGKNIGFVEHRPELVERYIGYLRSTAGCRLDGLRVVLDCANGAASAVMPRLLEELGCDLRVINKTPNGVNINDACGSTHLERLQSAVLKYGADIGIAHDGDADRCLCVDEKGNILDGDHILVICALAMKEAGTLKNDTVVSTVMANIGFHQALKKAGIKVEVTGVGDRYVLENMRANGHNLGGEQSGHIIFSDFATTGDGLITGTQVLCALVKSGKKASELNELMTSYPQLLVNVRVNSKEGWDANPRITDAVAAGEKALGDRGRILIRPSGTEPLIRVMAEGPDREELEQVCNSIADIIREEIGI